MIDERTELLINRKLDGELTEGEALELNKRLIRDPQARALLEEYTRMDHTAAEAIQVAVSQPAREPLDKAQWMMPQRYRWYSLAMISTVAAAVALALLLPQRVATMPAHSTEIAASTDASTVASSTAGAKIDCAANVQGPRRETETMERDVIGVWDRQSRSLYLLELNSDRSLIEPVRANY